MSAKPRKPIEIDLAHHDAQTNRTPKLQSSQDIICGATSGVRHLTKKDFEENPYLKELKGIMRDKGEDLLTLLDEAKYIKFKILDQMERFESNAKVYERYVRTFEMLARLIIDIWEHMPNQEVVDPNGTVLSLDEVKELLFGACVARNILRSE